MKIITLFVILCLFMCSGYALAQNQGKFDFRQTRWGMTMDEVKGAETKAKFVEHKKVSSWMEYLAYETTLNNVAVSLAYVFMDGKLTRAIYLIDDKFVSKNRYIEEMDKLKTQLTERYGQPIIDETIWRKDLYKDREEDHGTAYSVGDVETQTIWLNDRTSLSLNLSGEKFELHLRLVYSSKETHDEFINRINNDALNDL